MSFSSFIHSLSPAETQARVCTKCANHSWTVDFCVLTFTDSRERLAHVVFFTCQSKNDPFPYHCRQFVYGSAYEQTGASQFNHRDFVECSLKHEVSNDCFGTNSFVVVRVKTDLTRNVELQNSEYFLASGCSRAQPSERSS